MIVRRPPTATTVLLLTAALLSGCSGGDEPTEAGTASGGSATGSATGPSPSPSTTTPVGPPAALEPDAALTAATQALARAAAAVREGDSAAANTQREAAFTGQALRATRATMKGDIAEASAAEPYLGTGATENVRVLAVATKPPKGAPTEMLVQSGGDDRVVLHLLQRLPGRERFKVAFSATMLPGARISPFRPQGVGSPITAGRRTPVGASQRLLDAYAADLSLPRGAVPRPRPYERDVFLDAVTSAAREQRTAIRRDADFRQDHRAMITPTRTVQLAGGGTLALGVIQRVDRYEVRPGRALKPPSTFNDLRASGRGSRLTESGRQNVLEFLVFEVPRGGEATLVAANEHPYSAKGN